jgi:thioredoxin-like negative regulator of GroEL
MRRVVLMGALLLVASDCKDHAAPAGQAQPTPRAVVAAPTSIPFIEDDYTRALAEARAKHLPIFVDVWAIWCHSCMSMKEYVLTDPALIAKANHFVWLSIDSERQANDPFLARFSSTSIPTLWVIDAATERPTLKWIGTATASELAALLDDAAASARTGDTAGEASAAFARGNEASGAAKLDAAVDEYRKALAAAPPNWARRPQVVEALSMRLEELERHHDAVELAVAEAPKLPRATSLANVLQNGLGAAFNLPATAPERARVPGLLDASRSLAADRAAPLLADDRSSLYEHIVDALEETDPPTSKVVAGEWAAFLEGEAAKATTPAARSVFDPHRLLAYIALGQPERAIPMLDDSARDLPTDYDPHARLARAYFEMKRNDDALVEVDRALGLAYGPRKLRIYLQKADIDVARGDDRGARDALAAGIAEGNAMDLPEKYGKIRAELSKRSAALAKTGAPKHASL